MIRATLIFLFCLLNVSCFIAQTASKIDSLVHALPSAKTKEKANLYNKLSIEYWRNDPYIASNYADSALTLAIQFKDHEQEAMAYYCKGVSYNYKGNQGDALDQFLASKKIAQKHNLKQLNANALNAIGIIYSNLEKYAKSIETIKEAIGAYNAINDGRSLGKCYLGLANDYHNLNQPDSALYFCRLAMAHSISYASHDNTANVYVTLSSIHSSLNNFDSSLVYGYNAARYFIATDNYANSAGILLNIGQAYTKKKSFNAALSALDSSFMYANKINSLEFVFNLYDSYGAVYYAMGRYKESAEAYEKCAQYKDSVFTSNLSDKLGELSAKYDTEKKEAELKLIRGQKEVDALKLKNNKILLMIALAGGIVLAILLVLIANRYKLKKQSHVTLEKQNKEITLQKEEITDSINYAKRIQQAILPPKATVEKLPPGSFIFYRPKDIVSGDFYFVEKVNDKVVFAAVDCTGHGVPGAMVSVVGFNLLTQAVRDKELSVPSEILSHLDKGVSDTLRQSDGGDTIKDGMDLAVCSFDPKKLTLEYAGVCNSLCIVRKNIKSSHKISSPKEVFFNEDLLEVKSDKFEIGNNHNGITDSYTNHTFQLEKGDSVFIYSDGYADQFGGAAGKKFKYNHLKNVLIQISSMESLQQHEVLQKEFEVWKGNQDQVDDVLIMGMKVT